MRHLLLAPALALPLALGWAPAAQAAFTYSFVGSYTYFPDGFAFNPDTGDFEPVGPELNATASFTFTLPSQISADGAYGPGSCDSGTAFYLCSPAGHDFYLISGLDPDWSQIDLQLLNSDGNGSAGFAYWFDIGNAFAPGVYSSVFGAGPATLTVTFRPEATPVPLPASLAVLGTGLLALGVSARRRRA